MQNAKCKIATSQFQRKIKRGKEKRENKQTKTKTKTNKQAMRAFPRQTAGASASGEASGAATTTATATHSGNNSSYGNRYSGSSSGTLTGLARITSSEGRTKVLIQRSSGPVHTEAARSRAPQLQPQQLLSTNIHQLMRKVETERRARAAQNTVDARRNNDDHGDDIDGIGSTEHHKQHHKQQQQQQQQSQLWVDKYRPRTFVDLVSDDKTNRNVLRWLKQWDSCVFGRSGSDPSGNNQARPASAWNSYSEETSKYSDPLDRPEKRIVLLAGSPGLGKTTLAHIVAKQAGYAPIEINASDERTGTAVRDKLMAVTQMNSISKQGDKVQNGKPQLLIIDEIDGISAAGGSQDTSFVSLLIRMATAAVKTSKSGKTKANKTDRNDSDSEMDAMESDMDDDNDDNDDNDKSKSSRSKGKGKKAKVAPLRRPIICICNDPYVPALRALRSVAQIFHLQPIASNSLARRLSEVSAAESLPADFSALQLMAEKSSGDLRGCLNALQFVTLKMRKEMRASASKRRKRDLNVFGNDGTGLDGTQDYRLTAKEVERLDLGVKDADQPLYVIWETVFGRRQLATPILSTEEAENMPPWLIRSHQLKAGLAPGLEKLAADIQGSLTADPDKLVRGIFEHFPRIPLSIHDPSNSRLVKAGSDWLSFYDHLDSFYSRQPAMRYELNCYSSYALAAFRLLFTEPGGFTPNAMDGFTYPNTDYDAYVKKSANEATIAQFVQGLAGESKAASDLQVLRSVMMEKRSKVALELVPYVAYIVNPQVDPIALASAVRHISAGSNTVGDSKQSVPNEVFVARHTVNVLVSMGMNFVQHSYQQNQQSNKYKYSSFEEYIHGGANSGNVFKLEPSIDLLNAGLMVKSSTKRPQPLKYVARQVIAREVTLEKARRREQALIERAAAAAAAATSTASSSSNGVQRNVRTGGMAAFLTSTQPSHSVSPQSQSTQLPNDTLQKQKQKQQQQQQPEQLEQSKKDEDEKKPSKPVMSGGSLKSFFQVKPKPKPTVASAKGNGTSPELIPSVKQHRPNVWYKHNEGFTNAVRRPVKMSELL
ncbi:P-loop containing nucleoside triphosphate hydrolase protein [Ramicandelaber brevisporus]|nr:P-loop containing nucleoside triphosphate hydrolase protein [Ramicandelaber brevisporus]